MITIELTPDEEQSIHKEALEVVNRYYERYTDKDQCKNFVDLDEDGKQRYEELVQDRRGKAIRDKKMIIEPIYARAFKTAAAEHYVERGFRAETVADFSPKHQARYDDLVRGGMQKIKV